MDIAGTIKIADGTQAAGKVLTSDANGLATWATSTTGTSIYTTDGSLTSARTVTMGGNTLNLTGGNVGFGVVTPAAKVDIAGTIKIADGTQAAGKVLTSDANGLATWTTPTAGASIYTTDGSLTSARTVTMAGNSLNLTGGNLGLGVVTPAAKLDVAGTN